VFQGIKEKQKRGRLLGQRNELAARLLLDDRSSASDVYRGPTSRLVAQYPVMRWPLGVVLLLPPIAIVVGVGTNSVDRWLHGNFAEGYVLSEHLVFNPVDALFLQCAPHFPLDYCLWLALVLHMLLAAMSSGVSHFTLLGQRFLPNATAPRTILLATILLVLLCIGTMDLALAIAPRYFRFGAQTLNANDSTSGESCTLAHIHLGSSQGGPSAPAAPLCQMSEVALFFVKISLQIPEVGTWLLVMHSLFAFCTFCTLAHRTIFQPPLRLRQAEFDISADSSDSSQWVSDNDYQDTRPPSHSASAGSALRKQMRKQKRGKQANQRANMELLVIEN
jgi:LMBR1 domain-containing protein 1